MGLHAMITCDDVKLILRKFYGYVDNDSLKSISWLISHKKIDDPDIFYYSEYTDTIKFTAKEFREFMDLYEQDYNKSDMGKYCTEPKFKLSKHFSEYDEIYHNEKDKYITWG